MKFLIINASPNKRGMTSKFCRTFAKAAKKVGEVKQFDLHDAPPSFCKGSKPRPKKLSLYQKETLDCDALFIGTPPYWFSAPSILKAYIEDLDPIENDLWKRPRPLGMCIYAPEGGELGVAGPIALAFNHLKFSLVEWGYIFNRGIKKDDSWSWDDIKGMPKRMERISRAYKMYPD
ncbi:MAG: hypothetical protein G01um101418_145 [Parcubacteria group bacterium Gr01-1014_18]|nr:MAG: hypothetical protein Greene041636_450 [Parcubacteria group bacterium Greene0416_36]TSC81472.1 MAG: hypothetical protein G01um101418_145 [Parcubacteria group bacterium Gr01-1014_18]TSC99070.1 MAG: hypothetical protein Greene101420_426 [Parcubacteria group bacterium Greene1014_20]TSD07249.1 MAG: hypothetical protein Greene07142_265 [Parcubacteria group bacterium Greene0714_2]